MTHGAVQVLGMLARSSVQLLLEVRSVTLKCAYALLKSGAVQVSD